VWLVLTTLVACRPPARPATGTRSVVDDVGDTVALAGTAHRVVSLIPAATELVFALGGGDRLVGRTSWCDYPPAAARVANVGDGLAPNLEAVIARKPDLVLLYRSGQDANAAQRFYELGIPTLQLAFDRLADVPRLARLLGPLVGREQSADSLARWFDSALAAVSVPQEAETLDSAAATIGGTPARRRPRVFILAWDQPPMTIGAGSFLSELVTRAGGENLFADLPAPSGTVSIEAVARRDPDVILAQAGGVAGIAARPEWRPVRAVREGRFVEISSSAFNRPSPRAPDAIRELRADLARWKP
jgi:ABC-type Fe3+-hydroxamate transport system substrate-binding protein